MGYELLASGLEFLFCHILKEPGKTLQTHKRAAQTKMKKITPWARHWLNWILKISRHTIMKSIFSISLYNHEHSITTFNNYLNHLCPKQSVNPTYPLCLICFLPESLAKVPWVQTILSYSYKCIEIIVSDPQTRPFFMIFGCF